MLNRLFLLVHLLSAFSLLLVSANTYETDDAIIIEGKFKPFFPFLFLNSDSFFFETKVNLFFFIWSSNDEEKISL